MAKKLDWIFLFMIGISIYIWFTGDPPNEPQFIFRMGLLVVGLLGLVVTKLVAAKASKDS